ncbi:MAG TPA: PEGA domain-containing protein [Blastocatellia bacterium]|nr:PEGA domain-containing protein [Blastocatellia bacterium]
MKTSNLTRIVLLNLLVGSASPYFAQAKPAQSETKQTPSASSQILRGTLAFGLEDGTPITMRISRTISSADAKVDEKVDFEVLEEVKVGEIVVIPRGGIAWGTVTEAQSKRRMARGGKLNMNIDAVRLISGEKAALRAVKEVKGGGHTGAMTGAIVATSILFFPAAPLFLFMHGKDITIPKGTEITAYINGDVSLDPAKFSTQVNARSTSTEAAFTPNSTELSIVAIKSNPDGADIMIDGKFVGNAPSTVRVAAGEHVIRIEKSGFKIWQRQITVNSAGNVTVEGKLESAPANETISVASNQRLTPDKNMEQKAGVISNPDTDKSPPTREGASLEPKSDRQPTIVYLEPSSSKQRVAETAPSNGTQSRAVALKKIGQEATTDFGKGVVSFLFAITLSDHDERCRAEKAGDAEAYKKLKNSGKLSEVKNKTNVLIVNAKKDSEGQEVFEVRILASGKTAWIDSKFLR